MPTLAETPPPSLHGKDIMELSEMERRSGIIGAGDEGVQLQDADGNTYSYIDNDVFVIGDREIICAHTPSPLSGKEILIERRLDNRGYIIPVPDIDIDFFVGENGYLALPQNADKSETPGNPKSRPAQRLTRLEGLPGAEGMVGARGPGRVKPRSNNVGAYDGPVHLHFQEGTTTLARVYDQHGQHVSYITRGEYREGRPQRWYAMINGRRTEIFPAIIDGCVIAMREQWISGVERTKSNVGTFLREGTDARYLMDEELAAEIEQDRRLDGALDATPPLPDYHYSGLKRGDYDGSHLKGGRTWDGYQSRGSVFTFGLDDGNRIEIDGEYEVSDEHGNFIQLARLGNTNNLRAFLAGTFASQEIEEQNNSLAGRDILSLPPEDRQTGRCTFQENLTIHNDLCDAEGNRYSYIRNDIFTINGREMLVAYSPAPLEGEPIIIERRLDSNGYVVPVRDISVDFHVGCSGRLVPPDPLLPGESAKTLNMQRSIQDLHHIADLTGAGNLAHARGSMRISNDGNNVGSYGALVRLQTHRETGTLERVFDQLGQHVIQIGQESYEGPGVPRNWVASTQNGRMQILPAIIDDQIITLERIKNGPHSNQGRHSIVLDSGTEITVEPDYGIRRNGDEEATSITTFATEADIRAFLGTGHLREEVTHEVSATLQG